MHYGLLGSLEIHHCGRPIEIERPRRRALLAYLLLNANRLVTTEQMVDALWGERAPTSARGQVHTAVSELRKALGPDGDSALVSQGGSYRLSVEDSAFDVAEFRHLASDARRLNDRGDVQKASRALRAGLELWRGPALCGIDAPFAVPVRTELEEERFATYELLADIELGLGRHHDLVPELTGLLEEHLVREGLAERLMLALWRSGRQADAFGVYHRTRTALAEAFGVDPGPSLVSLHQRLLALDPELGVDPCPALRAVHEQVLTASPILSAQPTTADGTASRSVAEVPEVPPALPGTDRQEPGTPVPAQLPADTPLFTGRRNELRYLRRVLEQAASGDGPQVVTITGMGGVGKSALAIHAAHLLRDRFPDGQLHLDLRGFSASSPRAVHEVLATLLADLRPAASGASAQPLPDRTDERAALLRTVLADRRVLFLLDNARDSAQVLPLLPGTGNGAVIVTSRNSLTDLPTTHHLPLAPMDIEEQRALLSALCGTDRVDQDLDGALRTLAACAGLPLALRIVGARLAARPAWPLATLADRLAPDGPGRLAALAAGQLEVRSTFDSSYLALRDSDRPAEREAARAFRLLGLWRGQEFTPASASALLDRTPAESEDLLERLVDFHLLESPAPLRYRFHDLLAEYAAERAYTDETAQTREAALLRLCVWYALAVESTRTILRETGQLPPRLNQAPPAPLPIFADETRTLVWCRQELTNIGEAIRQAGQGPRPDLAWRLAVWLFGYMRMSWWAGQGEDLLDQALSIADQHHDRLGRGWLLRYLGITHGMARRLDKCVQALQDALELFDDPESKASIHCNLSVAHTAAGQADQALVHARAAFDLHRQAGSAPRLTALVVSSMADALRTASRHTEAEDHYRAALALWRERGDANSTAVTLSNLGDVMRGLGRHQDAFTALHEAQEIFERIGNVSAMADNLITMARTHADFSEWPQARTRVLQAIDLAHRHHLSPWLSEAHEVLTTIESAHAAES
ncbi:AfsR/SARP family transcriptional regulator [Kitasatospora cathayae]|uniref:BTAD domain-containing putative transcriptional regulator n=1 Tax=Kitasatospora cathayae TaxID=3004092 RepID=A0ABY7QF74_9ACTN|nr:BTAD domain-containing putative transcriptional regulator [Kitasatospora sp. HUAS 3-15]WBP91396.1 BTAD domain-containing putative transcriptional regulator [Kitasatospora sp. HUAS 3-15]